MESPHLDREVLSRFTEGRLPPDEARRVDQHLSICTDCRDRVDEISLLDRLEFLDALLNPGYDTAFERAADRTAEQLAGLREEARSTEDLFIELSRESSLRRRHRIVGEEMFHSLKLCEFLQVRSRESWFSDPSAAMEWAELAVIVAQRLDTGRYGSSLVEDARALSWAYVGNAYRITSDLWRAEQSVRQAWFHHLQAGEDVTTETELLSITSSLRAGQHRLDEAIRFADRAISLFCEGEQHRAEGNMLIQKGHTLALGSRFQEAIQVTRLGIARIDPSDLHLLLIARNNVIACIFNGGSPRKAMRLLKKSRPLYSEVGEPVALAQMRWMEGKFQASEGSSREARESLFASRDIFLELQRGREVFQTSLDLASILMRDGKRREAREYLRETIPLGEQMGGSSQEILAARLLYEQASKT